MTSLQVRAFAKINLNLKVLGRRPDGYHEIETLLQTVSLHDTLEISLDGEGLSLTVDDPATPAGPDNLVYRAAERLQAIRPPGRGPRLRLTKRIPAGAGLGGGSSDAAAALWGLDLLLGLGLSREDLAMHAAALGSDVPYFLVGGTALLTGRGTEVRALPDLPAGRILVLHPGTPLSTASVYAQLQQPLTLAAKTASIPRFSRIPVDLASSVRTGNDLEPVATRLCPAVGRMRELLGQSGAKVAAMTGSGSAVFGLFDDDGPLRAAARAAEAAGFRAYPCRTLDRESFHRGRLEP